MSPDELADALADEMLRGGLTTRFIRQELRTLAREVAKQALVDAADELRTSMFETGGSVPAMANVRDSVRGWLRARADQIGKTDGHT